MTTFILLRGGGVGRPPVAPPDQRADVTPPTEKELAGLHRRIAFSVNRSPQLWSFLEQLTFILDTEKYDSAEHLHALTRVLGGKWNSDYPLAETIAAWPALPGSTRRAIGVLATFGPTRAIPDAIGKLLKNATPDEAAAIAAAVSHHATRVRGNRDGRIATIVNTLPQLTDDEIGVIGPVIAAMVARRANRTAELRNAVARALRRLFTPEDWAAIAIGAVHQLVGKTQTSEIS